MNLIFNELISVKVNVIELVILQCHFLAESTDIEMIKQYL